jgi:hypothetical protein
VCAKRGREEMRKGEKENRRKGGKEKEDRLDSLSYGF